MVCSTSTIGGLVTQRRTNQPTNCNTQEPTQPAINNGRRRQLQDTASESSASDTNPNQGTIKPHRKQQQPRTHPHHSQTKQVNASIRYLLSLYNNSGMRPRARGHQEPSHQAPAPMATHRRTPPKGVQDTSCVQPPVSSQLGVVGHAPGTPPSVRSTSESKRTQSVHAWDRKQEKEERRKESRSGEPGDEIQHLTSTQYSCSLSSHYARNSEVGCPAQHDMHALRRV